MYRLITISCFLLIFVSNSLADKLLHSYLGLPSSLSGLEYLEDPSNSLTFDEVSSDSLLHKFKQVPDNYYLGVSESTFWLRFSINKVNESKSRFILELDNPTMEFATIYAPSTTGQYHYKTEGAGIEFTKRGNQSRNITFNLDTEITGEPYFMSLKSRFPVQAPLKVYKEQSYLDKESRIFLFFMLYVAVIAFTIIINFFYFFFLKDVLHLLYCGAALTMILGVAMISGFAYKFIWPHSPELNLFMSPALVFLSVFFIHGFARKLLFSRKYSPRADKAAYYIQILALVLLILPVFRLLSIDILNDICAALNIVSIVIMTIIAVQALKKGYNPALVYLIGFIGLATGTVFFYLGLFDIVANPIGFFCICIGSVWEMIFFMAGIALRYQHLKKTIHEKVYYEMRQNDNLDLSGICEKILVPDHIQQLSEREKEVLALIAKGHTDKEIAEILSISVTTVKTHARKIYSKLLVSNRTEAVSIANTYQMI